MKQTGKQVLIEKFQDIKKRSAQSKKFKIQLLLGSKVIEEYSNNKHLKPFYGLIEQIREKDMSLDKALENQTSQEMEDTCDQVIEFSTINKIPGNKIPGFYTPEDDGEVKLMPGVHYFRACIKGNIECTSGPIIGGHLSLQGVLRELMKTGIVIEEILNFVDQYLYIDNNGLSRFKKKPLPEYLESISKEIESFLKKKNIINYAATRKINNFREHKEKHSDDLLLRQASSIIGALTELQQGENISAKTIDFVKKFLEIDGNGNISRWKFSPSFYAWREERQRIEKLKGSRIWHSWDVIAEPYLIHNSYDGLVYNLKKDGRELALVMLDDNKKALEYAIKNGFCDKLHTTLQLNPEPFGYHLQELCNFAIEQLITEEEINTEGTKKKEYRVRYAPSVGHVIIDNSIVVDFKSGRFRRKFLKIKFGRKKPISCLDMYNKIHGTPYRSLGQREIKRIRGIYRGINSRFTDIGKPPLIDVENNMLFISSAYNRF